MKSTNIYNLYYRNPRLLILTIAVTVVAGLGAYQVLPRAEDPTLPGNHSSILTRFPGASAERVEALVTEKIEDKVREIEEIKRITSTSRVGTSLINVELEDEVEDREAVWSRLRDKVSQVEPELPQGADPPEIERQTVTAFTMIAGLVWELDSPVQYAIMRRVAQDLEDEFRAISGTAEVELFGDPAEEVRVEVNAAQLASLGLTINDVARSLLRADAKDPAGQLSQIASDLPLEVTGEVESLDRVMEIPVRSGPDGRMVRICDIASVQKTIIDPPSDVALLDGKRGIALAVRAEEGIRVDHWAAQARRVVEQYRAALPTGMGLISVFDQSRYVEARLDGLTVNMLIAMLLVLVVVFFMMGWRSAITVGVALPLASMMVLAGLRIVGIPMHQMSVTGLIVALGLLIDNAIVIVDKVRHEINEGESPATAITQAVRHLAIPLFGSTFTTSLAFMPLILMPGGAGDFVGPIGISVSMAIFSSLFLALTVIPALTGLLEKRFPTKQGGLLNQGFSNRKLTGAFRRWLGFIVRRPAVGIVVAVTPPLIGLVLASNLEEQFFPPADRDQFYVDMRLPSHTSLATTEAMVLDARDRMLAHPRITDVHFFAGTNAPKFYYNMFGAEDNKAFYAQAFVQMDSAHDCREVIRDVQRELDESFPQSQTIVRQIEQGPPFNAPVEVRLYGPDLEVLRQLGERFRAEMAAIPDTIHTWATLADGRPRLRFKLNEEDARIAGLDNNDVVTQIRGNLVGVTGGSLIEATEELPLRVRLVPDGRQDVTDIESLDLLPSLASAASSGSPNQGYVPLSALGTLELTPQLSAIPHRDGTRVNTVQAFITAGVLPAKVLAAFERRLDSGDLELPPGYRYEIGGEAAERDDAVKKLMTSVGILLVIMTATLVLTFGSFRLAALLGVVAGLSAGLGLLSLWICGYPFGFMAIIGTMGLVGVALNDSIVVLAAIREDRAACRGDQAAVADVVEESARHVLATTVTTVVGFIPLLVAGGGFWPPLAVSIAGGVVGATMLALCLIPSAYLALVRSPLPDPEGAGVSTAVAATSPIPQT